MTDSANPNASSNISSSFLPRIYRTESNKKFLNASIEQLVQRGNISKINGYIGRQNAKATTGDDIFISAIDSTRQHYQLEPSIVINDEFDNNIFFKDYQDYINQLTNQGGITNNHSILNKQEFYSWNPNISWDKFVNFQQYYWMENGPLPIVIAGQSADVVSTYSVTTSTVGNTTQYVFTPDGVSNNPELILYRGQTYYFDINSPGQPFTIKSSRTLGNDDILHGPIEVGVLELVVDDSTQDHLFYQSSVNLEAGGIILVKSIDQKSFINVELDIIGKKHYSYNQINLSNGMLISFSGKVEPAKYSTGSYYVEGVGENITLIDSSLMLLIINKETVNIDKDYITINKASKDGNKWSRTNKWVHADVIKQSLIANNLTPLLDQSLRASRPIIEFDASLKLINFGSQFLLDVDIIDAIETDVFSKIEGTYGYIVDGVDLVDGQYVIFTNESDVGISNNIYKVSKLDIGSSEQVIHFDLYITPSINDVVYIKFGSNADKFFWFNGSNWVSSQQKLLANQAPLFDVFDDNGISFSDNSVYYGSSFNGTKVFTYKVNSNGLNDSKLGFPLTYKNVSNIGDILFNADFTSDMFNYQIGNVVIEKSVSSGYLLKKDFNGNDEYNNGWITNVTSTMSETYSQAAVRVYKNSGKVNNFDIDIFDDINKLSDLQIRVYINGKSTKKYTVSDGLFYKKLILDSDINPTDILTIRAFSKQPVNQNGYYEIPVNLQNNPTNDEVSLFTLGEVLDHVNSIVDNNWDFSGEYPGISNLRDLGNISKFGTKFIKHSSPYSLSMYHITDDNVNVIDAIEKSKNDYNKFKHNFITVAETLGIDTDTKQHVDLILKEMTKNIQSTSAYYFSDMVPFGANYKTSYIVEDKIFTNYPLSFKFTLAEHSNKAVGIYLNGVQLIAFHDYVFSELQYVEITKPLVNGDVIDIYEYSNTDGCFVPETPSKLGIWPTYDPKKYLDTTLITPVEVIQGHDGSIVLAYGDYRDDLILELEKRIYNNIKVRYDEGIYDIHDIIPSYVNQTDYSLAEFNTILAPSFHNWVYNVNVDYTQQIRFDNSNPFTFNYSDMHSADDVQVPGHWRGIYKWMLMTDRPHLCPWEMLGLSDEPVWWNSVYGPAPYTSDNLILWDDISKGLYKEPGKSVVILKKFIRPFLLDNIPVDSSGNLLDPLACGMVVGALTQTISSGFKFGDIGPVENAWRRSSYYPFSVIVASILMYPSKMVGILFDSSRVKRNLTGQIVDIDTNTHINAKDVKYPSIYTSAERVQTSGLINYVINYIVGSNLTAYNQYIYNIKNINFNLSYRVAGFTNKNQFNFILDSKSPLTSGSVFVPTDDYKLILNKSTVVKKINYSGVIITKLNDGYSVKGYSKTQPSFTYYPWIQTGSVINVGGISENFVYWDTNQTYSLGQLVKYGNSYYRATSLVSGDSSFQFDKFQKLSQLPIVGGVSASFRKTWDRKSPITIAYNTKFNTIQDIVDFLLGYGEWLKDQGMIFDDYLKSYEQVCNWETSAKEFLFWTTQNWSSGSEKWDEWEPNTFYKYNTIVRYNGEYYKALRNISQSSTFDYDYYEKLDGLSTIGSSVISLSPSAYKITFKTNYSVVDDITNRYNDYEIFRVDGQPIPSNFLESTRDGNIVSYSPVNDDGIYSAAFYLVQIEHVLILNNNTVFNDLIYQPVSGYKQDRIKVSAYVNNNWNGGFDIPGFIYDNVIVKQWEQWKSYNTGDVVQYQSFYYSAKSYITGSEIFDAAEWVSLSSKPESKILPNWTTIATQFNDFYSLEVDSFDKSQQEMAQHLIGYQKRQYLSNIIQDDISEFKFYQGMIRDKGTQNVFNKLFGVTNTNTIDNLKFYEEWALRVGQYGASSAFSELEFIIDEEIVKYNPASYELVNKKHEDKSGYVIQIEPSEVYLKPADYNSMPWKPVTNKVRYLRPGGYVNQLDVLYSMKSLGNLNDTDSNGNKLYPIDSFSTGDYIWCTFDDLSWNVYRFSKLQINSPDITYVTEDLIISASNVLNVTVGQYVGIKNAAFSGFYKITETVGQNTIKMKNPGMSLPNLTPSGIEFYLLTKQHIGSIDDANDILSYGLKSGELLWCDETGKNKWGVYQYNSVYNGALVHNPYKQADADFGRAIATDDNGLYTVVSTISNKVYVYKKNNNKLRHIQSLVKPFISSDIVTNVDSYFGETVAISPDGKWIAVGSPMISYAASVPPDNARFDSTHAKYDTTSYRFDRATANTAVSTNGSTINLTNANNINTTFINQGVVTLYRRTTGNFVSVGTLVSPNQQSSELFGSSLDFALNPLSGECELFIGAPGSNTVYKIRYETQVKEVFNYNPSVSSGIEIGLSGDTLTVSTLIGLYVIGTGFSSNQQVIGVKLDNAGDVDKRNIVELSSAPDNKPSGKIKFVKYEWVYDLFPMFTSSSSVNYGRRVKSRYLKDNANLVAVSAESKVFVYIIRDFIAGKLQTTFNSPYNQTSISQNGYMNVFINGNRISTSDFTAVTTTYGQYIVLNNPCSVGDNVTIIEYFSYLGDTTSFGYDISLSSAGEYIAISEPEYGTTITGLVYTNIGKIHICNNTTIQKEQELINIEPASNEYFGTSVSFFNDDVSIAVYSQYTGTVSGKVDVYDKYNSKWIYSERLSYLTFESSQIIPGNKYTIVSVGTSNFVSIGALNNNIGTTFDATGATTGTGIVCLNIENSQHNIGFATGSNIIMFGTPFADDVYNNISSTTNYENVGLVYVYTKKPNTYSWGLVSIEGDKPDLTKIKSAFLYNKLTNKMITYLDVIDPLQGKIAGPADMELSFKTMYDPAVYTIGTNAVNIDETSAWTTNQVGQLWWDLRTAKFVEEFTDNIVYRTTSWNKLVPFASIDIYEWVETKLTPSEWDAAADTDEGLAEGISGLSLYGDSVYSVRTVYDNVSKINRYVYYYWVKNKVTIPNVQGRNISANQVSALIASPINNGYSYAAITGLNTFILTNINDKLSNKDVVFSIQNWISNNIDQNIHTEWKLISNDPSTSLPSFIENKWIDSLCGFDSYGNVVPDNTLPLKLQYGIENRPRQSMFINKNEALKQVIESINKILINKNIVNSASLSKISSYDVAPAEISNLYDITVDSYEELSLINTKTFIQAIITPVITDGKITSIIINNKGKGYKKSPKVTIKGDGVDAEIQLSINNGSVNGYTILNPGNGYNISNTVLTVRSLSALVLSDSNSNNDWAVYSYVDNDWFKVNSKSYDVRNYWDYTDWYENGYNQFTAVNYEILNYQDLTSIDIKLGDIVKVRYNELNNWVLLLRIPNDRNPNNSTMTWYDDFKIIGVQNGTIQFNQNLYLGTYDAKAYSSIGYDYNPSTELHIILSAIKDIFISADLKSEYLELFFNSIKYAHTEQNYIDWVFKTSFIKVKNTSGRLNQPVIYENDNLIDYENYISEVKPYKTKVRQYVSSYINTDVGQVGTYDFDSPPIYSENGTSVIEAKVVDGAIVTFNTEINKSPWKEWYDNIGFSVIEIILTSTGYGYDKNNPPTVTLSGNATAVAIVNDDTRLSSIVVTNKGSGYVDTPSVTITESMSGYVATAVAIIGDSKIRSTKIGMKFDRIMNTYEYNSLTQTESFVVYDIAGRSEFDLTWPPDITLGTSSVTILNSDGTTIVNPLYTLSTQVTKANVYAGEYTSRIYGKLSITLDEADLSKKVQRGSTVEITYKKDISILQASDRIGFFYEPSSSDLGKDLSQLITGVDYGGVNITGLNFLYNQGWDSSPYMNDRWDSYDPTYTDYSLKVTTTSNEIALPVVPPIGSSLTIYCNGNRLDDQYYGVQQDQDPINFQRNSKAIMVTPTFNGVSDQYFNFVNGVASIKIPLSFSIHINDIFTFRDVLSDGSVKPDVDDYDATYDGGNLEYTTATGYRPSDIIVDGDKDFVTPSTSYAPDEVVPGQVVDSLMIRMFNHTADILGNVKIKKHIADGIATTFSIGEVPNSDQSIIVTIEKVTKPGDDVLTSLEYKELNADYSVHYDTSSIVFYTAPEENDIVTIYSIGVNVSNVLDIGYYVGTYTTTNTISTKTMWKDGITGIAYISGQIISNSLVNIDGYAKFVLPIDVVPGVIVNYIIIDGNIRTFTITSTQEIVADGRSTPYSLTSIVGDALNTEDTMIVRVGNEILPSSKYTYISNGPKIQLHDTYIDTIITVYSSYNNVNLGIQREEIDATPAIIPTIGSPVYYKSLEIQGGIVDITATILNEDYLWVVKNGVLLVPGIDYVLNDNHSSLTLLSEGTPADVIDVITFDSNKKETRGFMLFKDMLNRVHYKNLISSRQTKLAKDLNITDEMIELEDASNFDPPNPRNNKPGVIVIGAERIEYFNMEGNILSQLRRATLGTGARSLYKSGVEVTDIGPSLTIIYNDVEQREIVEVTEDVINNGYIIPVNMKLVLVDDEPWAASQWEIGINYLVGDVVYGNNLKEWKCIKEHTSSSLNTLPTGSAISNTYWNSFNYEKCDDIDVFVNNYNITTWEKDTQYNIGELVRYNQYTYRCINNIITDADKTLDFVTQLSENKWKYFVPNVRLKKSAYVASDVNISRYSPEADIQFDEDFTVDDEANEIRLTQPLAVGTTLTIVKKTGTDWIINFKD